LDGLDHPRGGLLLVHRGDAGGHDGVGLCAAYINLAFVGLAGQFQEWLGLEAEPSIWISFVLSMGALALVMRKG
jgi:predicted small integral membrane protein